MSELDSFLTRCYDVLLNQSDDETQQDEELCACAHMLKEVTA